MTARTITAAGFDVPIDQLIHRELPAAAQGDRDAYGRIVLAAQNTITAVALAITRDVASSEDIAQEAFLSAWQHLRRLQNPNSFLPWMRQITRNLARDHLRASRHRPLDGDSADLAIANAADPSPSPMQQLIDDEREAAAADLISALPEDSREVLLLYYREGQSSQQVATLLGLSDAAVRKRLSRARQCVRDDLLLRFGEFARGSAPTVAFASIVGAALTLASPPAAAKALLSVGAAAGSQAFGKVLLASAGTIGVAMLAAFGGIYLGLRKQLQGSIDDDERKALLRSAVINGGATLLFVVSMLVLGSEDQGWILPVLATLGFMVVIFYQGLVAQPKILARRHALQAAADPVAAAKRRRRERIQCWIGSAVGLAGALGGLIGGLMSSGRI